MPDANFALSNTYESVVRPAAYSVAKDCLRAMGFPEAAYINFVGYNEATVQKDSTLTPTDNKNYFGTNAETTLKVSEEPLLNRVYEASLIRMDNLPIFRDPTVHTYIRPAYRPTRATLNFKLTFTDEVAAGRWYDDIWARSHLLRHQMIHKLTYHYQIPPVFLVTLNEIYKLREAVDQVGDTFGEWLKANLDPRATTLANQAGGGLTLVMPEEEVRVVGWFDFSGMPGAPTYNKDKSVWEVEWDYIFVYDRPYEAVISYPLVVRQQLLGPDFRPTEPEYALDREFAPPNNVGFTLGQFFHGNTSIPPKGILDARYPLFDTWVPEGGVRNYKMLWVGLVTISPQDRRSLLNLHELGNHKLSAAALALIQAERQYTADPGRSIFEVGVYSNNERALPGQVLIDENLNVVAYDDISLQPVYHVVVSVCMDLLALMRGDGTRLRNRACLVYEVLKELYPRAFALGLIPPPSSRCTWTEAQWQYIAGLFSPPRPGARPWLTDPNNPANRYPIGVIRQALTIGDYHIVTRRN